MENCFTLLLQKKEPVMKKIATFAIVLFLIAISFSACKSTEDCPAYSQAETELPVHA
jgi:hypothetical protein